MDNKKKPGFKDFKIGFKDDMNRKCRRTMEDAHAFISDFPNKYSGFFAVYDGHAGKMAAQWCGDNLHSLFEKNLQQCGISEGVQAALSKTFVDTNGELTEKNKIHSGCTAITAFIQTELDDDGNDARVLYTANAGDARAVLSRSCKAIRLSYDHKVRLFRPSSTIIYT